MPAGTRRQISSVHTVAQSDITELLRLLLSVANAVAMDTFRELCRTIAMSARLAAAHFDPDEVLLAAISIPSDGLQILQPCHFQPSHSGTSVPSGPCMYFTTVGPLRRKGKERASRAAPLQASPRSILRPEELTYGLLAAFF